MQDADGAGAEHQHKIARPDGRALEAVAYAGERLVDGGLFKGHPVAEHRDVAAAHRRLGDHAVFREAAVEVDAQRLVGRAQMAVAAHAAVADAAAHVRSHRDPLPLVVAGHPGPDRLDDPGDLVAEHPGMLRVDARRAVGEHAHVGAADGGRFYL